MTYQASPYAYLLTLLDTAALQLTEAHRVAKELKRDRVLSPVIRDRIEQAEGLVLYALEDVTNLKNKRE